jgi:hypothetical protein
LNTWAIFRQKQLRDRVFTWIDFAVAKIRKCSKTAFYGSDDIITLFESAYQRKLRQKYERKKSRRETGCRSSRFLKKQDVGIPAKTRSGRAKLLI